MSAKLLRSGFLWAFWALGFLSYYSGAASAEGSSSGEIYEESRYWTIFQDFNRRSCTLVFSPTEDSIVYLGLNKVDDGGKFYFIFMKKGLNFSRDKKYKIDIVYNKGGTWADEAPGATAGDYGGIHIDGLESKFVVDFAASSSLSMAIDGVEYGDYSIRDARSGMQSVFDCNKKM